MTEFKTKKAREEWLRSNEAWAEVMYCPPVRISELWIKRRHFVKIQRMYRRSHYDYEAKKFVYDEEIIMPDTSTQIYEVDVGEVIKESQSIKALVDIMIQEGM